jgi:hypothetical protein
MRVEVDQQQVADLFLVELRRQRRRAFSALREVRSTARAAW